MRNESNIKELLLKFTATQLRELVELRRQETKRVATERVSF